MICVNILGEKLPTYLTFPEETIAYSINVKVGKQNYALVGFGGIVSPLLAKTFFLRDSQLL
jgi:hypothetical protein